MRYDARTVFVNTLAWYEQQEGTELAFRSMAQRRHAATLRVFVHGDDSGCFLLNGADKVYWEPGDADGFRNTARTLADEADDLGHVILTARVTRDERIWPTWQAFAEETGLALL